MRYLQNTKSNKKYNISKLLELKEEYDLCDYYFQLQFV